MNQQKYASGSIEPKKDLTNININIISIIMNIKLKIAIMEHPEYKNQADFAIKLGMTPDKLSKIIHLGGRVINAQAISTALDKTIEELEL